MLDVSIQFEMVHNNNNYYHLLSRPDYHHSPRIFFASPSTRIAELTEFCGKDINSASLCAPFYSVLRPSLDSQNRR